MNNESSESELDVTVERLKMKYLERKRVSNVYIANKQTS